VRHCSPRPGLTGQRNRLLIPLNLLALETNKGYDFFKGLSLDHSTTMRNRLLSLLRRTLAWQRW